MNTGHSSLSPVELSSGLPDLLAPNLKIIFCGINPGLKAAAEGHHFAGRGNRFWRVLHLAGFTPTQLAPEFDSQILEYGYGLTAAVSRPTARADQLAKSEFSTATTELEEKLTRLTPRRVAFLGKPAFTAMYQKKSVDWGQQHTPVAGVEVWVLPNPSGLNRGFSLDDLVAAYKDLLGSLG